jgi:hypothetical protein
MLNIFFAILATTEVRSAKVFVNICTIPIVASVVCIDQQKGKFEKLARSFLTYLKRCHAVEYHTISIGISTNIESSAFKFVTQRVVLFRKILSLLPYLS